MCGIAGIAHRNPLDPSAALARIDRMVAALRHRGPDDRGTSVHANTALGHARLSIIDLSSAGRQPMELPNDDVEITFNGEIYNYRDLQSRLQAKGRVFTTSSDTEILLHGYKVWGIHGLLDRIEGMFAFAIRDGGTMWLARDAFGIKPLYYRHVHGQSLEFASEMKALEAIAEGKLSIDYESLLLAFHHFAVPAPRSIRRGYAQIEPGHLMQFDIASGEIKIARYWQWEIESEPIDENHAVDTIWNEICSSVEKHLIADVEVGVFLSGGLDSSLIAAACARIGKKPPCLTIQMTGETMGEAPYAEALCEHYGLPHQVEVMDGTIGRELDNEMLPTFDEPFNGSAALSSYWICKVARKHRKVMLSGEGGDELFGGYTWYRKWCQFYGDAGKEHFSIREAWRRYRGKRYMPQDPIEGFARLLGAFDSSATVGLFDSALLEQHPTGAMGDAWYRKFDLPQLQGFDRLQWMDMHGFLPTVCLPKMDRTSMAHGLEVRVPLLDRRLAEIAGRIPREVRNPDLGLKGLLKKVAASHLPDSLLSRKKKGFSPPMRRWFDDCAARDEIVSQFQSSEWWQGIFSKDMVNSIRQLKGRSLWRFLQVWRFVRNHHTG
jgi:asparagine synthase (glutamine-hydrolysing)